MSEAKAKKAIALSIDHSTLWSRQEANGKDFSECFKELREGEPDAAADAAEMVRARLSLGLSLASVEMTLGIARLSVTPTVLKGMVVRSFTNVMHKFAPDDQGKISGYASTPGLDSYNHRVLNGAFQESIDSKGLNGSRGIKLILDHDHSKPAGVINRLAYDATGLAIEAKLSLDIPYVADRYAAIKALGGLNYSVGFFLEEYRWVETKNGPDELIIEKGDLFEISVVTFPGNEAATLQIGA
ncbi:HK97 family phage prohead protease [Rhizobium sp. BG4]|uniref:HK97 family phage prohead protease n=1 Tax=Rhizobium sp. BG4 TaxID=2613770 RepID=UPI00193E0FF0|nr:HK97 family phage prohead protease [Rhizobium sp. BG4]